MKRYLPLLHTFLLLLLFSIVLSQPSSVLAFCNYGYCVVGEPNDGCPYNPNFNIQEVCSVQPPQNGACCAYTSAPPPPPPSPSPSPSPSCIKKPGSFASYDGCISGGYSRFNYYNCDGTTFSVDYPNPDCNYLNPLLPCDAGQVCDSCTLIASGNACSGNGSQSCVYTTSTTGGACEQTTTVQTCNVTNCSLGYSCSSSGTCVPTPSPSPCVGPGCGGSRTCNFNRSLNQCCDTGYSKKVDEYTWSDGSGICNKVEGACNQANPACTNRTCNFNRSLNQCCDTGYSKNVDEYTWSDGSGICNKVEGACNQANPACTNPPTCNFDRSLNQCCDTGYSKNVDEYTWSDGSGVCNSVEGACNQADPACTNRTCNIDHSYNQCCADGYSQHVDAGTWSDGNGVCWETIGPCDQVDAACSSGTVRYGCSGSSCIRDDANGTYSSLTDCNNACGGDGAKYGCSGDSCVLDPNGSYTSSTCDGSCSPPPPPPVGSLLCPIMHPFAQIRNLTKNQQFPTSVTYKGVTYDLTSPGACASSGPSCGLAIESAAQSINASPGDVLELRVMVANEGERSGAIHSVELRFWGDKGITAYPNGLADDEAGNVGFCTNSYFNGLTNFANAGISCVGGGSMGCYPGVPWTAYTTDAKSSPGEAQAWGTGVVSTNWNTARYQVPANVVLGTTAGITAVAFPNGGVQTPSGLCFWDWNGSQGNKDFRWKTDSPMCPFTNDMYSDSLPLTVTAAEPTVPICGYIRNSQTDEPIQGVQVQVYDNNLSATRTSPISDQNGFWQVDKFVRPGDSYAVRIPGNLSNPQTAPTDYVPPAKISTVEYSWNFNVNPNPGTNPWADARWDSTSYEGQKAGSWDCAGADPSDTTCRCNFIYKPNQVESSPPPPTPPASIGPWIQTTGGDVHSNTRINTPGGP